MGHYNRSGGLQWPNTLLWHLGFILIPLSNKITADGSGSLGGNFGGMAGEEGERPVPK